ncbi:MAG: hypothetical protein LBP53_04340 [Candidatus Peribacteria bacterium]|nr:hypothetical protein [Candidatus Peribacteria bacterium]
MVVVFRSPDNPPKEKVYLKENNDIYINIFEATNEHQKNDKIRFNHNFFKKSGNVVISQLYETNERKQMQKLFFNDTVYELDNPESEA